MKQVRSKRFRLVYLLLAPPYLAILWVSSYNFSAPEIMGIPFFYWYQLLWIPLGALLLYPVYRAVEHDAADGEK